jgi:hypothetical protein
MMFLTPSGDTYKKLAKNSALLIAVKNKSNHNPRTLKKRITHACH